MRESLKQLSPADRRKVLFYLYWLYLQERLFPRLVFSRAVRPVTFALLAGFTCLMLLSVMPKQPVSILISFGAGLSFALIATSIRRARFAHFVGQ